MRRKPKDEIPINKQTGEAVMVQRGLFSREIGDRIVAELATGKPLLQICAQPEMPCDDTVRNWAAADEAFGREIARARNAGFDAIAARARQTARGKSGEEGDSSGDVQRDKLIVDTDLKLLAKWDPKRYGERITQELTGPEGRDLHMSDHETAAKLAALLAIVQSRVDAN